MTFKDVKAGYLVYLLHRKDNEIKVTTGKVTAVSLPRIQVPQQFVPAQTQQLVVDVTIDDEGITKSYTIPETHTTTYAGNDLVLSTTKDGILREVEAMKASAEEVLASVDKNKAVVSSCDKILTEWNPVFKEKKETEERFGKIENALSDMSNILKAISDKVL